MGRTIVNRDGGEVIKSLPGLLLISIPVEANNELQIATRLFSVCKNYDVLQAATEVREDIIKRICHYIQVSGMISASITVALKLTGCRHEATEVAWVGDESEPDRYAKHLKACSRRKLLIAGAIIRPLTA